MLVADGIKSSEKRDSMRNREELWQPRCIGESLPVVDDAPQAELSRTKEEGGLVIFHRLNHLEKICSH